MKIRLAGSISVDSIVDGVGLRTVVWTQGCHHRCPGCHNPETWDMSGGIEYDADTLVNDILDVALQSGVTLSGGDPFFQPEACTYVAEKLKAHNKTVWCYTGFLYEDLLTDERMVELLKHVDVLVDGPFIKALKTYNCKFRGSSNQRLIDVPESLKAGKIVLWGGISCG